MTKINIPAQAGPAQDSALAALSIEERAEWLAAEQAAQEDAEGSYAFEAVAEGYYYLAQDALVVVEL